MVFTVDLRKLYFVSFFFFFFLSREPNLFVCWGFFLSPAELYLQMEHLPLLSRHSIGVALLQECLDASQGCPGWDCWG